MRRLSLITWLIVVLIVGGVGTSYAEADDTDAYTGFINDEQFFQAFPVSISTDGLTLVINLEATSGDLDTLLYLLTPDGDILAENDDVERGNSNSRIVYPNISAGDYIIIATRFRVEGGAHKWRLRAHCRSDAAGRTAISVSF